jgi:hypothetical protein
VELETWELLSYVVTVVGLPRLLHGVDPSFVRYVERLAASAAKA